MAYSCGSNSVRTINFPLWQAGELDRSLVLSAPLCELSIRLYGRQGSWTAHSCSRLPSPFVYKLGRFFIHGIFQIFLRGMVRYTRWKCAVSSVVQRRKVVEGIAGWCSTLCTEKSGKVFVPFSFWLVRVAVGLLLLALAVRRSRWTLCRVNSTVVLLLRLRGISVVVRRSWWPIFLLCLLWLLIVLRIFPFVNKESNPLLQPSVQ